MAVVRSFALERKPKSKPSAPGLHVCRVRTVESTITLNCLPAITWKGVTMSEMSWMIYSYISNTCSLVSLNLHVGKMFRKFSFSLKSNNVPETNCLSFLDRQQQFYLRLIIFSIKPDSPCTLRTLSTLILYNFRFLSSALMRTIWSAYGVTTPMEFSPTGPHSFFGQWLMISPTCSQTS